MMTNFTHSLKDKSNVSGETREHQPLSDDVFCTRIGENRERFLVNISNATKNTDEVPGDIITNCVPPSVGETMGISSGLLLFRRWEMITIHVEKHFSNLTRNEGAITIPKNMESNPTRCTALTVGQVQELINKLPENEEILQTPFTMKDIEHHINLIRVTRLADLVYSSFTPREIGIYLNKWTCYPMELQQRVS